MTIVVNVGQAQKLQKVSPFGFQFFTRLAAVFAEELIHGCFDPC
tara:strand:- start:259 stop:390 length:132 start_codon:yes stop_codon:yes gene_type:complete